MLSLVIFHDFRLIMQDIHIVSTAALVIMSELCSTRVIVVIQVYQVHLVQKVKASKALRFVSLF